MAIRDSTDSISKRYAYDILQSLDPIDVEAPNYQASTQLPGEHPSAMPVLNYQASTTINSIDRILQSFPSTYESVPQLDSDDLVISLV